MKRSLRKEMNHIKAYVTAPKWEQMGTPGLIARTPWGDAKKIMRVMLLSMTPPIHVDYEYAAEYIESCISGAVRDRLTKDAVVEGDVVQLYVLSYRHESARSKMERLSRTRLNKTLDVIRNHTIDMGQSYYSIWIDSLFLGELAEELDNWADRGLSPYAFCYVVISPGLDGCEADLKRTWILCEHQLAVAARGVLMHVSDEKPAWAHGKQTRTGKSYVKYRGGSLDPRFALRVLAVAISAGLIDGTEVTYTADRDMLQEWSTNMVLSKWPGYFWAVNKPDYKSDLPGPIGILVPERLGRLERLLRNLGHIVTWGTLRTSTDWDVLGPIRMLRHYGPPRRWNTGYDLIRTLCRNIPVSREDGATDELYRKITERSEVNVVVFDRCYRGLVMCAWSGNSEYILMDVELVPQPDGEIVVSGCNMIFNSRLVWARHNIRFERVAQQNIRMEFLNDMSQLYYSRIGPALIAKRMYPADCSRWIVM